MALNNLVTVFAEWQIFNNYKIEANVDSSFQKSSLVHRNQNLITLCFSNLSNSCAPIPEKNLITGRKSEELIYVEVFGWNNTANYELQQMYI